MNAAETGLEEAMWSINKQIAGSSAAWTGWDTSSGSTARRTFSLGTLSGGATAQVKVHVNDRNLASDPVVIARSIITPPKGPSIEKWVQVSLSHRSIWRNGIVGNTITLNSDQQLDSYDSRLGPYGGTNRNDATRIGSISVAMDALAVGAGDVWGHAAVGAPTTAGITENLKTGGRVGPYGTPANTIATGYATTDFTMDLEIIPAPTTYAYRSPTSGQSTLPVASDAPAADGKYYYELSSIGSTLNITAGKNVIIRLTETGPNSIKLTGNSDAINVPGTSTLEIYTPGDVKITGQGVANGTDTSTDGIDINEAGRPKNFKIYGTGASGQSIAVGGKGSLSGVVYAPNADLAIHGNGDIMGAFIAKTVAFKGNNVKFHFDESLSDETDGEPFGIDDWKEYVSFVDRNANLSKMNF